MTLEEKITYLRENHPENVPIAVAAKMLGKNALYVRESLKDGSYPFGNAVKRDDWSFNIPTERFIAYLSGEDLRAVSEEGFFKLLEEHFIKWYAERRAV